MKTFDIRVYITELPNQRWDVTVDCGTYREKTIVPSDPDATRFIAYHVAEILSREECATTL